MEKIENENWRQRYFNKKIVDFSKYLNEEDIQILEKLEIKIEDKIYTEYEFDIIEQDLLNYYKGVNQVKNNNDDKDIKPLINGITEEQYNSILEKFDKMSKDYKI